jgi:CSLREA domain-containing protein
MTRSTDSREVRSRVTSLAWALLAALWLMPGGVARAATIAVTTVADENGSGPNCSLREAIASANGDADVGGCAGVGAYGADTIVFASTLSLPATITLTDPAGALTVSSDVTITGPGAAQLAIDGNHTTGVFFIDTGQVMMSALTIRNGNSGGGGGIANIGGTLTLATCRLSGNSADGRGFTAPGVGGAIYNGGTLTLTNCALNGNSASGGPLGGGGIFNGGTLLTLTNCTLSGNSALTDNSAYYGGGIYNIGGTLAVVTNTVVANSPSGGDCTGAGINDGGHNLVEDATNSCGLANGVNGNLVGVDPVLSPLANNGGPTETMALLDGSPAINAGDPDVCANPPVNGVDQRGYGGVQKTRGLAPSPARWRGRRAWGIIAPGDHDRAGSTTLLVPRVLAVGGVQQRSARVPRRRHLCHGRGHSRACRPSGARHPTTRSAAPG